MEDRRLRFSERKRLAETGSLGEYEHEQVPPALRNALWYLIYEPKTEARDNMVKAVEGEARLHFGWAGDESAGSFVQTATVDELLDFLEILAETCASQKFRSGWNQISRSYYMSSVMTDAEAKLNNLFERHRFGYRFEGGEARKLGSPSLDEEITGPALLAVSRPGWEQVERSFREALDHQRGGETDDAVTAAHAALEAALKAVGMTGQFGTMVKQFRDSELVPPYLRQIPEALDALLTLLNRSNAIRSTEGDAHGKAPGSEAVPQHLADLAIHWAGAFIVYLAE